MDTPDITNASRQMKVPELERCERNGVTDVTEYQVGYDGIVLAQAASNPAVNLTREQIALAVVSKVPVDGTLVDNPYTRWSEIDPALPDRAIVIYGPPTTSGTRDAFEELVLEPATEGMDGYGGEGFTSVRADGVYIDSGENDNLIVQKIEQDTDAFGIFGYGFLEENRSRVAAATVDGVEASPETVSSGEYPVSRSLWFYVKNAHLDRVPGLEDFIEMFLSDMMAGPDGLLRDLGLIALPEAQLLAMRARLENRTSVTAADLH
jgi:phosphate transport system substrate-binding protein